MRNTLLNVHISLSTRPPNGIGDKSAERSTGRQLPPAGTRRFSWNEFWVSPVDLECIRSRSLVLESCFKCRGEYQPLTWRFCARPFKEPGQTVQEFTRDSIWLVTHRVFFNWIKNTLYSVQCTVWTRKRQLEEKFCLSDGTMVQVSFTIMRDIVTKPMLNKWKFVKFWRNIVSTISLTE